MSQLPGPFRAAVGLVATALDGARTLPQKAVEVPVIAVSTVLQLSLRAQQRYAELALRGDELLGRWQQAPDEPPSWATFDEPPAPAGAAGTDVMDEAVVIGRGAAQAAREAADAAAHAPVTAAAAKKGAPKKSAGKKATEKKATAKRAAKQETPARPGAAGSAAAPEAAADPSLLAAVTDIVSAEDDAVALPAPVKAARKRTGGSAKPVTTPRTGRPSAFDAVVESEPVPPVDPAAAVDTVEPSDTGGTTVDTGATADAVPQTAGDAAGEPGAPPSQASAAD